MGFNLGDLKGLLNNKGEGGNSSGGMMGMLGKLPLDQIIQKLPLDKLLTPEFMQKHTPFQSIGELLQKTGLGSTTDSPEKIKQVPAEQMDSQVSQNTQFGSLQQMLQKAAEFYTARKGGQ
ncbi:hypothetical protein [Paenibacillus bovis]|uniref:Uncharacterized protein n=1 Tax=Paenibacillus bovis TaxID=1616788 RepID=A0A172ZHD9_9BACL|nr:hypothetical protein [Paenibacillus bovis]ANF97055.1 hypothetical protein AR543_14285 [Paenibacillus bovis]